MKNLIKFVLSMTMLACFSCEGPPIIVTLTNESDKKVHCEVIGWNSHCVFYLLAFGNVKPHSTSGIQSSTDESKISTFKDGGVDITVAEYIDLSPVPIDTLTLTYEELELRHFKVSYPSDFESKSVVNRPELNE